MAYINGNKILFSSIINGTLINEDELKYVDIYKKMFTDEPVDLIIPDGITAVSSNLQYAPITTRSISGASVTELYEYFFSGTNIETVDLPNLTTIGDSAFLECGKLIELNLPKVTTIGDSAFRNADKLNKVTVGTLISTQRYSFRGASITELYIGKNTSASLYISYMTFTQEILHGLIDNLADMTGKTAPAFQVGSDNLTRISDEYKVKLTEKNWHYS